MANVIPSDINEELQGYAWARFIIVGAFVALACAAIAFLLLMPSYLAIVLSTQHVDDSDAGGALAGKGNDTAVLSHASGLLKILSPIVLATSTPTQTIQAALAMRPQGVHVDQILYHAGGTRSSLMLSGSADSNSEINSYRNALAADPRFVSVSIPVGALVGTDGGRFSITLSGDF